MRLRFGIALLTVGLVAAVCTAGDSSPGTTRAPAMPTTSAAPGDVAAPVATSLVAPSGSTDPRNQRGYVFPPAPAVTVTGELSATTRGDLEALWGSLPTEEIDRTAIDRLGQSGDVRLAWLLADLLRFIRPGGDTYGAVLAAWSELTATDLGDDPTALISPWQSVTDHLIAWDLPAHPEYREYKGRLFTLIEPRWQPFFDDAAAAIDWRLTSWGGVRIDDRPLGATAPCELGCIPALDDPAVTSADEGDWYSDERIVFGVVVNGEARAYPKHQMETHEMINDTLGGRRIGLPYCTLCGSAQAYFTDSVPDGVEIPVLRTSGLLTRSNKVMFDLATFSIFDTFTGDALSGPLGAAGITLEQTTVVTSTWGDWRTAHPETTIVARDGGIQRSYRLDPLRGRDDDGAIFPIGAVDPRLPVQAQVVGVIAPDGTPVAFPAEELRSVLAAGGRAELGDVVIAADGGGFVASRGDGTPLAAHQSFWFAWSQFHPDTLLWTAAALGE